MTFSQRTAWSRRPNAFAEALEAQKAQGRALLDLTESNPTRAGLFDGCPLVAELGDPRGARYEPDPMGHAVARRAVATYYRDRGTPVDDAHVVLSASTSESYGWLFKLLCDPGDEVLVPTPGYPLFSFLADMEGVRIVPFPLRQAAGWGVDLGHVEASLSDRTRAIVLVSPNNPTGSFVHGGDREALVAIARERGLALVVDEVFGDYAFDDARVTRPPSFAGEARALTFVLSGLSKVVALPQLKLGWMVVSGPDDLRTEALHRLELVADSYLSVATPVQLALPRLLTAREEVAAAIRRRTRQNLGALDQILAARGACAHRLSVDAGWYATLEASAPKDEERVVLDLLREDGVVVHPGHFFDMDGNGHFVVSLLTEPDTFAEGAGLVAQRLR